MTLPRGGFNNFPAISAQVRRQTDQVIRAAAFNIGERIVASMQGPKSGRMYGGHQASAPGEAPAILYGTFANSIHVAHPKPGLAIVYSNDEKGPYLEFGTRHMAARPSFRPAAEAEREPFERAMRSIMSRLG